MRTTIRCTVLYLALATLPMWSAARPAADERWQTLVPNGSGPTPRHEAAAVEVDGRLYLLGGRGSRPFEVFDPATRRWRDLGALPVSMHHFQPVAIGSRIYVIGALTGGIPDEQVVADVWVFDTDTESWSQAGEMPASRRRGSVAAVAHEGLIYLFGGNLDGHAGPSVAWLDRYDPETRAWEVLVDAPHARDHVYAARIDDRLFVAGGRRTDQAGGYFDNTEASTDVYDVSTGEWSTAEPLPTPRAGAPVVAYERELIVIGGESAISAAAFATVEALDVDRNTWRTLEPLIVARHGGGAAVIGDTLHVVAGNTTRGGGAETDGHETLALDGERSPDADRDGLDDAREVELGTDPDDADTDDDGLEDGEEVERNTDPQRVDTDDDALGDGEEVNTYLTDPLRADTDNDGIGDGAEVAAGTDPNDENDPDGTASGGDATDGGTADGGTADGGTADGGTTDGGTTDNDTPSASGGSGGGVIGIPGLLLALVPVLRRARNRRRLA